METCTSRKEYTDAAAGRAVLPEGFGVSTTAVQFYPAEIGGAKPYSMNLSLILLDKPTDAFHAVFTKNLFCGAPVIIGKQRLKEKFCRGVLANNKVSNVAAPGGVEDATEVLCALAASLAARENEFFASSTGIIGWKIPVKAMCQKIPELIGAVRHDSLFPVAEAIMTTDSYPKIRSAACGQGRIVACAKGAGMIEPNMATMLVFILTDVDVKRALVTDCLKRVVRETFNTISIDGDQSTSDMAIMMSSAKKPTVDKDVFYDALREVCRQLSDDIVRNGEGVSHVIKVTVAGAPGQDMALEAGKAVVNSPLVKTAIFGNDPNVGRIIGALGDFFGSRGYDLPRERLVVSIGKIPIFEKNQFVLDGEKERRLVEYLKETSFSLSGRYPPHNKCVEIFVNLNVGRHQATVLGADLTYDYVKENAAYRS